MRTGVIGGLIGAVLFVATASSAAEPPADQSVIAPEELRADFAQMYQGLKLAHFDLYAFTPQRQLDRRYAQLLGQIDRPMSRFEAKVLFELFAADVRMGHTRIDSPTMDWNAYRKGGGKGFPLQIRIVDGRTYVAKNLSGVDAIHPGDEITRLNGQSMQRWLQRTERHVSAETTYMAQSLMAYDFAIYLWVELGAVDAFEILARHDGSPARQIRLPARTSAEM
jgi:hypothetical protein